MSIPKLFSSVCVLSLLSGCLSKGDTIIGQNNVVGAAGSAGAQGGSAGGGAGGGAQGAGAGGSTASSGAAGSSGSGGAVAGQAGSAGAVAWACDGACSAACQSCGGEATCATPMNTNQNCGACGRSCKCDGTVSGCTDAELLVPRASQGDMGGEPTDVASGGGYLYFRVRPPDSLATKVFRLKPGTGSPKQVMNVSCSYPYTSGIAVDNSYAYFAACNGIWRIKHGLPDAEQISTLPADAPANTVAAAGITILQGVVYATYLSSAAAQLYVARFDTGMFKGAGPVPSEMVPGSTFTHSTLHAQVAPDTDQTVYVCLHDPNAAGLYRISPSGDRTVVDDRPCVGVAVDDVSLYYRTIEDNPNAEDAQYTTRLYKAPKNDTSKKQERGSPVSCIPSEPRGCQLVKAGKGVFYAGFGPDAPVALAASPLRLRYLPVGRDETVPVATQPDKADGISGFAADDTHVYWSFPGPTGGVFRAGLASLP